MYSKAWDWKVVDDNIWESPCKEYYYLMNRWSGMGYKRILDLGTGKGRHAIAFAKDGFKVKACDLSEYGIEYLRNNCNGFNIECECCDMLALPYKNEEFDCLFAYHVISHTDNQGIKTVIKEISRVIRPCGEIFIDFVSAENEIFKGDDYPRIDDKTVIMQEKGPEYGLPHYLVDYKDIAPLLKDYFDIISIEKNSSYNLKTDKTYGIHYYVLARRKK